jgi:hypothetical protein
MPTFNSTITATIIATIYPTIITAIKSSFITTDFKSNMSNIPTFPSTIVAAYEPTFPSTIYKAIITTIFSAIISTYIPNRTTNRATYNESNTVNDSTSS